MENPASWGVLEHAINDAIGEYYIARNRGVVGASLTMCIANAVRKVAHCASCDGHACDLQ